MSELHCEFELPKEKINVFSFSTVVSCVTNEFKLECLSFLSDRRLMLKCRPKSRKALFTKISNVSHFAMRAIEIGILKLGILQIRNNTANSFQLTLKTVYFLHSANVKRKTIEIFHE